MLWKKKRTENKSSYKIKNRIAKIENSIEPLENYVYVYI